MHIRDQDCSTELSQGSHADLNSCTVDIDPRQEFFLCGTNLSAKIQLTDKKADLMLLCCE